MTEEDNAGFICTSKPTAPKVFHSCKQALNMQPKSTAGVGSVATPCLREHRALNIVQSYRTTILYVQTNNDKLNINSKIPRAQPQLQLN